MRRWTPPGYEGRVRQAFNALDVTQTALVEAHPPLRNYQVSRWLGGAVPEQQAHLELFATALGVTWQWLVVGDWTAGPRART